MTVGTKALLDTGALVALLDRSEKAHAVCAEALTAFRGVLMTTEPVLTEAMYLLGRASGGQEACLDLVLRGGCVLVPMTRPTLVRCRELLRQYADIPMDLADASLVALAEETEIRDIFTLDLRGFNTYRADGRHSFRIHP